MAYSYDRDDGTGTSGLVGAGGLGAYDNDDLYGSSSVGGLGTRDYDSGYDTLGSAGLGGLDSQLGGLSLDTTSLDGARGLGSSGLYDSGYDSALSGTFAMPEASSPFLDGTAGESDQSCHSC